jgi:hypothetical protein
MSRAFPAKDAVLFSNSELRPPEFWWPTFENMPSPFASAHHGRLKMEPMTADQAATLKRLAEAAYEREAFKPNLTRAEADVRIATLTAKLKLLGEPPHTL